MKSHIVDKPFQCATCNKFFKNKQCLKKHHIRKHSGMLVFEFNRINYKLISLIDELSK